jgi:Asp/Glu/hydantoin racemase
MPKTLAFIHTAPLVIPLFMDLHKKEMPNVDAFNIVDESLLKNTIRDGSLSENTIRRLVGYVTSAADGGADAVLVTCSSIGPAVEAAREAVQIPVLRVDEAMAEEAVWLGPRIGVAATLLSTLKPTVALLKTTAAAHQRDAEVISCLCEGAFDAVSSGDAATHDRIVTTALLELMNAVDVIVLAQASMARVVAGIPAEKRKGPILSSPELAMARAKQVMERI